MTNDTAQSRQTPTMKTGILYGFGLAAVFLACRGVPGSRSDSPVVSFVIGDLLMGWIPVWGVIWAYRTRLDRAAAIVTTTTTLAAFVGPAVVFLPFALVGGIEAFMYFAPLALGGVLRALLCGAAAELSVRYVMTKPPGPLYYLLPPTLVAIAWTAIDLVYTLVLTPRISIGDTLLKGLATIAVCILACFLACRRLPEPVTDSVG